MRIVIFSKLFWPEGGGAELATYTLVKEVLSKYFDITIVSGTKRPHRDILKCCRYIHWGVLESRYKPVEWLKLFLSNHILRKFVGEADVIYISSHTLLPLAIAIKRIKPSVKAVLLMHNYQPLAYTSIILHESKPDLRNDVIVERYEHSSIIRAVATGILRDTNILNVIALHYADLIICVSKRQYEILTSMVPKAKPKTRILYNPLPNNLPYEVKSKEPIIVYPSGYSYIKGFSTVLACLRGVARRNLDVRFKLLGHYNPDALRVLKALGSSRVEVIGRLDHDNALRVYGMSWALLFPTVCEEPLPYAVVESMAMGTIPIASRVGGVPEIVEGTPAEKFLCEPGDVECFVEKIGEVASLTPEELTDIGLGLREEAMRRFSVENVEKKLMKTITSLIEG